MAERAYAGTGRTTGDVGEKAAQQFDKISGQVEGVARAAVERGREMGENVQEVAETMKTAVDNSVKNQPMTTLAVAAVVGFVLGALWKS